jgi:hypothetical protein
MQCTYRHELHGGLFRILSPGGLFVDVDKYAPQDDAERFNPMKEPWSTDQGSRVPPGRLERPRTAPEAAALSTELRGLTWVSVPQSEAVCKPNYGPEVDSWKDGKIR